MIEFIDIPDKKTIVTVFYSTITLENIKQLDEMLAKVSKSNRQIVIVCSFKYARITNLNELRSNKVFSTIVKKYHKALLEIVITGMTPFMKALYYIYSSVAHSIVKHQQFDSFELYCKQMEIEVPPIYNEIAQRRFENTH